MRLRIPMAIRDTQIKLKVAFCFLRFSKPL